MALVKVYTHKLMGQNRESRNRPTKIQSTDFWYKYKGNSMDKR